MDDHANNQTVPCADKLAFDTREQAEASALVAELQHGTKLKVYQCNHCRLWHLASTQLMMANAGFAEGDSPGEENARPEAYLTDEWPDTEPRDLWLASMREQLLRVYPGIVTPPDARVNGHLVPDALVGVPQQTNEAVAELAHGIGPWVVALRMAGTPEKPQIPPSMREALQQASLVAVLGQGKPRNPAFRVAAQLYEIAVPEVHSFFPLR